MTKYAVAMPCPAGNAPALAAVAAEALGPRLAEHTVSRQRLGITDERCWLQQTPAGPKVVYYKVARNPVEANRQFAVSTEPYDVWFKREFGATIGADLNEPTRVTSELVYESVPAGADPKHGMAMALPIVDPAAWRRLIAEINGPRRADHDDFHRRIGATDDRFQVSTPRGDAAILYLCSEDMGASVGRFVASQEPHDVWLKQDSFSATGIDWNRPPQGPLPELVFSWQAN